MSSVPKAFRSAVKYITNPAPKVVINPSNATDTFRPTFKLSSKKAIPGCNIEIELVIAAKNKMKKNAPPKKAPNGIFANTNGNTVKPNPNVPCPATDANPKNATAAGTVINPPKATSQNSFALLAVNPLNTTSSFFVK